MPRKRLLTPQKRQDLGKRIAATEMILRASLAVLVPLATLWVGAQGVTAHPEESPSSADGPGPAPAKGCRFARGERASGFPFEIASNKPFVQVRIPGGDPLWFILDTGAFNSALDREVAHVLGLETQRTEGADGIGGGSVEVGQLGRTSLALPGLESCGLDLISLPLASLNPIEGRRVEGLLGYDFIHELVIEVNYAERQMSLHDPLSYQYSGTGSIVPVEIENGWAFVRAQVIVEGRPPIEGKFLLDTGVRAAVLIGRSFAEQHGISRAGAKGVAATVGRGIGGESKGVLVRLNRLSFGGFDFEAPVAALSQDEGGFLASPDYAGIIGGEILRRFTVILDYSRQRIVLEPNRAFEEPFAYDASGAFLTAEGPRQERVTVWRLIPASPGADAGLMQGDLILRVDDAPASELGLEGIRQMFMQPGGSHVLEVQRGDSRLKVNLHLRALL